MRWIHVRCATFAILVLAIILAACGGGSTPSPSPTPIPQPVQPPALTGTPDQNADALIAVMTTDEKIQLVHGTGYTGGPQPRGAAGYVPGVTHLNVPDLYLADGSVGVGNSVGQATALPSSIASAASWDLSEAYKYGQVIGAESKALGMNVNLGGNVNLIGREPRCGRTFETAAKIPCSPAKSRRSTLRRSRTRTLSPESSTLRMNDQETSRFTADVQIDERGARESDLLAFEIGVKDSGVQSVMCSYNLIGGTYSCENSHLLTDILKNDWGFQGFVMSDWDGTHSTVKAATQPDSIRSNPRLAISKALKMKALSWRSRTATCRLRCSTIWCIAFCERCSPWAPYQHPTQVTSIDAATDAAVAQEMEEQGAVLLKNAGGQLPLSKSVKSIAVIGSHADIAVLSGGGSAQVTPVGGAAISNPAPCPPCWGYVVWDPSSPLKAIQAKFRAQR